jgi:hypothetical protein
MDYMVIAALTLFGNWLSLLVFVLASLHKFKLGHIIWIISHLGTSLVCFYFDFQPWVITASAGLWLLSMIILLRNNLKDKGMVSKTFWVVLAGLHLVAWVDGYHERYVNSGLWYSRSTKNYVINQKLTLQLHREPLGGPETYIIAIDKWVSPYVLRKYYFSTDWPLGKAVSYQIENGNLEVFTSEGPEDEIRKHSFPLSLLDKPLEYKPGIYPHRVR